MKRLFFYFVIILLLSVSCRKEEVFNPSRKIQTIQMQMPTQMQQIAQFEYDKNTLVALQWAEPEQDAKHYELEYNKDKTIAVIYDQLSKERAELTYEKKLLKEIKFYVDNQLTSKKIRLINWIISTSVPKYRHCVILSILSRCDCKA